MVQIKFGENKLSLLLKIFSYQLREHLKNVGSISSSLPFAKRDKFR